MEKNKKVLSIIVSVAFFLSGLLLGQFFSNQSEEEVAEVKNEIIPTEEFNAEKLKNNAVLFTKDGVNMEETENLLKDLGGKYNVPVVKMKFDENAEKFIAEQEKIVTDYYPVVADIGSKLLTPQGNGNAPTFNEELNNKVLIALSKIENKEDAKADITELAKQSSLPEADIQKYLEYRLALSKVVIERPIEKEEAPLLVLFDNNKEFARINALEQDKESLTWLLISKGFGNLNQDNQIEKVIEAVDKKEEFIVAFGTSNCPYCANTSPLVEKEAKNSNIPYYYVDINTIVNIQSSSKLISKNVIQSDIESTPTVIYFKDGKEINRFIGQQDIFGIEKFILDTQKMIKSQEDKAKEDTAEKESVKEEVPADEKSTDAKAADPKSEDAEDNSSKKEDKENKE